MRIHLTAGIRLEAGGRTFTGGELRGRLGRLAFVFLVAEHRRPVSRDELAEVLWEDAPPPTWEKGVTVAISRLRAALTGGGVDGRLLTNAFGCYQLHLPAGTWVDIEEASNETRLGEAALGSGSPRDALTHATRAASLARGEFMTGEDGRWVRTTRNELRAIRVRALDCLAATHFRCGDVLSALQCAGEIVALEPYRESAYVHLMRAHAAAGDRAEALRLYERCRLILSEELGVSPSPATESAYLDILRATAATTPPTVPVPPAPQAFPVPSAPPLEGTRDAPREPTVSATDRAAAATVRRVAGRHRRHVAVAAVLLPLVASAATAIVAGNRSGSSSPVVLPGVDTVARIASSADAFSLAVKVGQRPSGVVVSHGKVWVINYDSRTLWWLDPVTGATLGERAVGGVPTGIAAAGEAIWVTTEFGLLDGSDGSLLRFDDTTGEASPPVRMVDGIGAITADSDVLWATDANDDTVVPIDAVTRTVGAPIHVGRQPAGVAAHDGFVWVANSLDGTVSRVDAAKLSVVATYDVPGATALAADARGVWVVSRALGTVTRIDPISGGVITTIKVGGDPTGVATDGSSVWVSIGGSHDVARIDAATDRVVATLHVAGNPDAVAAGGGGVWIAVGGV